MDRELNTEILIDYHFGTLPAAERAVVEEALVGSPEALRAYLQIKRQLDRAQSQAEDAAPSPEARLRLRASVAELVRPRPARRLRGLLARPVPLYQTLAAAAVAGLLVAAAGAWWPLAGEPGGASPSAAADATKVDFARSGPQGLAVF
jgi:anti-sigma-K factor RskA